MSRNEEAGEFGEGAFHLRERGFAGEDGSAARQMWIWMAVSRGRGSRTTRPGPRAQQVLKTLACGRIERVFAFDVAGAEVVADRVAEDVAVAIDGEGESRARGRSTCESRRSFIAAAMTDDAMRRGLEEDLGAVGVIDAVVERAAAGDLRLLHARVAAAQIRDARGPDFLVLDGREQELLGKHGMGRPAASEVSAQPRGGCRARVKSVSQAGVFGEEEAILAALDDEA